jgi:hypothetical protein
MEGLETAELKKQPGKNIAISGSATLVHSLLQKGLLEEDMVWPSSDANLRDAALQLSPLYHGTPLLRGWYVGDIARWQYNADRHW